MRAPVMVPCCEAWRITCGAPQARSRYLFDGEVIDQVVIVFVQAAVQGDTVGVEEQILPKHTESP